jgi:hypothetical protein
MSSARPCTWPCPDDVRVTRGVCAFVRTWEGLLTLWATMARACKAAMSIGEVSLMLTERPSRTFPYHGTVTLGIGYSTGGCDSRRGRRRVNRTASV